tara:strand:- start:54 stop:218 length:165 start_codon:yes stop_codon:yes gene_type:complete
METLKALWYIRKVKVYESLIIKVTQARILLKEKQAKFTKRQEHYAELVKQSKKV